MNTEETQKQEEIKEESVENTDAPKTFSEEEVQKMIQIESDKRVNQALESKKADWAKEQEAKIAEEKRQAQLSEEEKWKEKFDAQVKQFEADRLAFEREKLKSSTLEKLGSEGLPTNFVSFIVGKDEEETQEKLSAFKEEWTKALQSTIDDRLKSSTPKDSNASQIVDDADKKKMKYSERIQYAR